MQLLGLQRGIIYGPVNSRRLGKSLGINLMPSGYKLCSFDCVYCHYGWTAARATDLEGYRKDLPTCAAVAQAVQSACTSSLDFDYLTFSGNGEPALHPDFPRIARDVADIRNRYRPRVRIALLSNSTGFAHPEVQDTLAVIDVPVLKLDAGTEHKFEEINRPAPEVSYQRLIEIMQRLEGIRLQTTFVDGPTSNTADLDLAAYFARVREIGPVEVHIYSTDRPVPNSQLALVPPERLREIAERGERETGVAFKAFYL